MIIVNIMLYRITCKHFCAGFIVKDNKVVYTAPILWRIKGKTLKEVYKLL